MPRHLPTLLLVLVCLTSGCNQLHDFGGVDAGNGGADAGDGSVVDARNGTGPDAGNDQDAGGEAPACREDLDGDGFLNDRCRGLTNPLIGFDCDDNDGRVHPDGAEACNGLDDDCDSEIDEERNCDIAVSELAEAITDWGRSGRLAADANAIYVADAQTLRRVTPDLTVTWQREYGVDLYAIQVSPILDAVVLLGHALTPVPLVTTDGPEVLDGRFVLAVERSDGTPRWTMNLHLSTDTTWHSGEIDVDDAGEVYFAAEESLGTAVRSRLYYGRLSGTGVVRWITMIADEPHLNGNDPQPFGVTTVGALRVAGNGSFYLAGTTSSERLLFVGTAPISTAFLVRISADGVLEATFEGLAPHITAIGVRADGTLVIGGQFDEGHTWLGASDHTPSAVPGGNIFVASLDRDLHPQWVWERTTLGSDYVHGVTVDANGNAFVGLNLWNDFATTINYDHARPFIGQWISGHLGVVSAFSPSGNVLWQRDVLTPGYRSSGVHELAVFADGTILGLGGSLYRLQP